MCQTIHLLIKSTCMQRNLRMKQVYEEQFREQCSNQEAAHQYMYNETPGHFLPDSLCI